jgi:AraC family transcriptional regulator of adaptative response/methylated-DNA-[protein]-cysteine methyltransferase
MPKTSREADWSPTTENNQNTFNGKHNLQKIFKKWTDLDHKLFTSYLMLDNIKDYLLESRSTLKTCAISELFNQTNNQSILQHVTYITVDHIKDLNTNLIIRWSIVITVFGQTLVAILNHHLCAIFFIEKRGLVEALKRLQKQWPNVQIQHDQNAVLPFALSFNNNLAGNKGEATPIILNGTKFQITIWKMLLQIPYGFVISYSDLASSVQNARACRAVGTAVGQNPIAYIIPCHRVIHSSGAMGQYHWGSEKKRTMLAIERTIRKS